MQPDVTTTGAGATGRMQRFVTALLTAEGALIEPVEPDALEVLSPPRMQTVLDLRESTGSASAPLRRPVCGAWGWKVTGSNASAVSSASAAAQPAGC